MKRWLIELNKAEDSLREVKELHDGIVYLEYVGSFPSIESVFEFYQVQCRYEIISAYEFSENSETQLI